ncbi:MAG TPA: protease pro-enzyme activation domain-containing protein [Mycobacteriales bacterium]|nr:protease pro-enzyme activation domain-containing protein [Mycobacteriales bacterium]
MSRRLLLGAALAALTFGSAAPTLAAAPAARATQPIAISQPVRTLLDTVPALVHTSTDLGALSPRRTLHVLLPLALPDQAALSRYVDSVYQPHSASFHRFLSPQDFGERFGAPAQEIGTVTRVLQRLGLHVTAPAANHLYVEANGPVSLLESVFGTALHSFTVSGRSFFANIHDIRLPSGLSGSVAGVIGLDDASRPVPKARVTDPAGSRAATPAVGPIGQSGGATPCAAAVAGVGYTAPQLATAYDFNGLYAKGFLGQGMSAALVEFDDYHDSNVKGVESCYHLSTPVTRRLVSGGTGGPPAGGEIEDMADITTMLEMLPKLAHLYVYVAPITSTGELELYSQFVTDRLAPVISSSWGNCEDLNSAADNRLYAEITEEAAAQGQQIFDASGDSGAVDCSGIFPSPTGDAISVEQEAAVPWVTGVGGTDLGERTANGLPGPRDEATWNDGGATGGGVSALWRMPAWQHALPSARHAPGASRAACGAPKGQLCREVPDLSADADPEFGMQGNKLQFTTDVGSPGYSFFCATANCSLPGSIGVPLPNVGGLGGWQPVGGTSLSTPLTAAAALLWDQEAKASHLNGLGLINPSLYRVAADPAKYARDFHDITSGSNDAQYDPADCPAACNPHHLYAAGKGYDMATGLGSYDAADLGADLVAEAEQITLTPDQVSVYGYRHGVTTTAPVTASSGYRSASYTAHSNQPWLHVKSGKAPGSLRWSVSPGTLSSGTRHGTITVDSHGHKATLHVTYSVSPPAKLKLSTTHLRFSEGALTSSGRPTIATCAGPLWDDELYDSVNGSTGHKATPTSKQTLRISNAGAPGSKLHWQALPDSEIGSWLSVDLQHGKVKTRPGPALVPTDGTAPAGHHDSLRLVSLANGNALGGYPAMEQGTYHGTVKVYDLADPRVVRTVHARLRLGNGSYTPYLRSYVKATALTLKQGQETTTKIELSDGSGSCGYSYSVGSNRSWVRPNAADFSGTVAPKGVGKAGGSDTGAGTGTIEVVVSAKGLKPGRHTFTITVQSQDAEPSPDRIPFTLTVK